MTATDLNVLLLARSFPPADNIASLRCRYLAKHLIKAGWNVRVVTVDPVCLRSSDQSDETIRFLRTKGLSRILTGHNWRFLTDGLLHQKGLMENKYIGGISRRIASFLDIDPGKGWIKPIYQACEELKPGDVQMIVASGPPFSSFIAAHQLARKLKCSFSVDYRDLWCTSVFRNRDSRFYTQATEKNILKEAACISVVSPTMGEILSSRYGFIDKIMVLTNGYDHEDLSSIEPFPFDHFAVVYCGSLHPPVQSLDPVLRAIKKSATSGIGLDDIIFHYFGRDTEYVRQSAARCEVSDRVQVHGRVSHREILSITQGAGAAVIITAVNTQDTMGARAVVTGKLFETIGLKTPVILLSIKGSDACRIVESTGCGKCFDQNETDLLVDYLKDLKVNSSAQIIGNSECYDWHNMIGVYSARLKELM